MSIASQELMRKMVYASDFPELSGEETIPEGDFQRLMQVQPVKDPPDERDFFSLFRKEEEKIEKISPKETSPEDTEAPTVCCLPAFLSCSPITPSCTPAPLSHVHVTPPCVYSLAPKEEADEISPEFPEETPNFLTDAAACPLLPLPPLFTPLTVEEKQEIRHRELSKLSELSEPSFPISCTPPVLLQGSAPDPLLGSTPKTFRTSPLTPAIEAAFEKMASCMLIMSSTHETETTFFLDNPQFASSALFGTQITIREFSTAPKIFNIEMTSNPHGVAMMEAGRNSLLSAFENAQFNFKVHRFETQILHSEKSPVFHRKEHESGDRQNQKEGRRE